MAYSPELAQRVDAAEELDAGSVQEVEIRAATVVASAHVNRYQCNFRSLTCPRILAVCANSWSRKRQLKVPSTACGLSGMLPPLPRIACGTATHDLVPPSSFCSARPASALRWRTASGRSRRMSTRALPPRLSPRAGRWSSPRTMRWRWGTAPWTPSAGASSTVAPVPSKTWSGSSNPRKPRHFDVIEGQRRPDKQCVTVHLTYRVYIDSKAL